MRVNLLTMRKEHMEVNQRLVYLENERILNQLDYQWKNTVKIMKRNEEVEEENRLVRIELGIKEEVVKEIGRKLVVAKRVIKKLEEEGKGIKLGGYYQDNCQVNYQNNYYQNNCQNNIKININPTPQNNNHPINNINNINIQDHKSSQNSLKNKTLTEN